MPVQFDLDDVSGNHPLNCDENPGQRQDFAAAQRLSRGDVVIVVPSGDGEGRRNDAEEARNDGGRERAEAK